MTKDEAFRVDVLALMVRGYEVLGILRQQPKPNFGQWDWPAIADDLESSLKRVRDDLDKMGVLEQPAEADEDYGSRS